MKDLKIEYNNKQIEITKLTSENFHVIEPRVHSTDAPW